MIGRPRDRVIAAVMAAFLACSAAAGAVDEPLKAAPPAAEAWLKLVDAGLYAESWKGASALFRQQVTAEQWEKSVRAVQAQTGKLVSRTMKSAQYTKTLPNAPEGEYVILQYDSSFANMKSATETVVPMKEKDGSWKVSGYWVK